jgi:uncharacterized protein
MVRVISRCFALLLLLGMGGSLFAEKAVDLPLPTTYVNDFAHVLSAEGTRQIELLCRQVHLQGAAEIVVVTVKTLDEGQDIESFTTELEDKWKVGKKGVDRGALVVVSIAPKRIRAEMGFGLEGILNDAKVGRILDTAIPSLRTNDYDRGLLMVVQGLADVIAADKGVALEPTAPVQHTYHREQVQQRIGPGQIIGGVFVLILVLILARTGHLGWAIWLLLSLMGGGGGGGGSRGGDDEGGGFGGMGGGSSGGGGASRDY